MTTIQSNHATETRTVTGSLCKGAGEVCAGTAGGFFDSYQEQWFPDEQSYTCPCCKGNGEVDETFCLICTEKVHACSCTDEKYRRVSARLIPRGSLANGKDRHGYL